MTRTAQIDLISEASPKLELGGNQGILPCQMIDLLIKRKVIKSTGSEILPNQIQPASMDLRLGRNAWRVKASFLPGKLKTVAERLKEFSLDEIDLQKKPFIFERGCFYIVELQEVLQLPEILSAVANPKSSTGRLDVFTRLITDQSEVFDWVGAKYAGKLYVEVCPITFSIKVRMGSRLNQLRFLRRTSGQDRHDRPILTDRELHKLHRDEGLTDPEFEPTIRNGLNVRVDLVGKGGVVGYRAQRFTSVVDVDEPASLDRSDFWEPVRANKRKRLTLNPNDFYILASKERMHVPPGYAAEMAPIDPMMGEFRAHYAGFFDPGFGHMGTPPHGSKAVLEVRSHDIPFVIEDGQIIARLLYERLTAKPAKLYGREIKSNYQGQGLKLSKHFK